MFIRHNYLLLPVTSESRVWVPSKKSPIQVVDGFLWNPFRERFEDVRGATYQEIVASLGINQLIGFGVGAGVSFTPVTNTYTSGTAATENVPAGATSCTITLWGGGGAGGRNSVTGGSGGGGGGKSVKTITVTTGDTFTYTVGALVAGLGTNGTGSTGNNSTVTGTVAGGAVSMTGNGGAGGGVNGGYGGTASGGDTNPQGDPGTDSSGAGSDGDGGAGGGSGGAGGTPEVAGTAPGGGGGGSTAGTSGGGARGQVSFAYT